MGFSDAAFFYVGMEFCGGGDLKQFAARRAKTASTGTLLDIMCQTALGIKCCHDNRIIHRDIKVHNFFVTDAGRVKLGDWGFARDMTGGSIKGRHPGITEPAMMMYTQQGTPYYLAPEQCAAENYNSKVDVWAYGCAVYELCTNRPPFQAGHADNLVMKILRCKYPGFEADKDIQNIVQACLQRFPQDRPSITEVIMTRSLAGRVGSCFTSDGVQHVFGMDVSELQQNASMFLKVGKPSVTLGHNVYAAEGKPSAARDGNAITHPGRYGGGCYYKGDTNSKGQWHGAGKAVYPNGDTYEGEWKNDYWEGHGVWRGADGTGFTGNFSKDLRKQSALSIGDTTIEC